MIVLDSLLGKEVKQSEIYKFRAVQKFKSLKRKFLRNVFVEGTPERFDHAKRLIDEIVFEARRLNKTQSASSSSQIHNVSINAEVNPCPGPHSPYPIPNSLTGLIIGKNGDTIK